MSIENTYFGKGIIVSGGFDLQAKVPLDSRARVPNYAGLGSLVENNAVYEGIMVYVEENKKTYQYIENEWKELGAEITEFSERLELLFVEVNRANTTLYEIYLAVNNGALSTAEKVAAIETALVGWVETQPVKTYEEEE